MSESRTTFYFYYRYITLKKGTSEVFIENINRIQIRYLLLTSRSALLNN